MAKYELLFITILVQFCNAGTGDEKCQKVPPIENFDIQKVMGKWYTQEINYEEKIMRKCLMYNIKPSTNDKMNVICTVTRSTDTYSDVFMVYQIGNSNGMKADWFGKRRTAWLVNTDYNTYSIWYICNPEKKKVVISISTRERHPDNAIIKKAREDFEKAGFDLSNLTVTTVDQNGCKN